MMTKPGITELDKYVDSRYTLVSMVAKRARMISAKRNEDELNGSAPLASEKLEKSVTAAVNEITDGVVGYVRSEAIDRARQYEQDKINAISMLENEQVTESSAVVDDAETETE